TALVFLQEPQTWLQKKMKVTFKPVVWNSAFDMPMIAAPQYRQYETTRVEFYLGGHLRQIDFKAKSEAPEGGEEPEPEKGSVDADGSRLAVEGYVPFIDDVLGGRVRLD